MSEIDSYRHAILGIVSCPSDFEIVPGNDTHQEIPLYRLDEDAAKGDRGAFEGARKGDLLLGGGGGESAAMRISIPEAIRRLTREDWDEPGREDDLFRAAWSANEAYVFCSGYAKLGWTPKVRVEAWLTGHILAFLLREYADVYGRWFGPRPLRLDGSICRRPSPEEELGW